MIAGLEQLRAAAKSGKLVSLARRSLINTLGEGARPAVESPAMAEVLRAYGDALLALAEAVAGFNADAESAERLSVEALRFRDALLEVEMHVGRVQRETFGFKLQ